MHSTTFCVLVVSTVAFPLTAAAYDGVCSTVADVEDLPSGHWCSVPDSRLISAEKEPFSYDDWDGTESAKYNSYQRVSGVNAVTNAWSGAALDTKRDCLMVMGGGHNDYGGNEVYRFCLSTLQWSRATDPTVFPSRSPSFQNDDGTPVSRHTYGGLAYLPMTDQLFVFDGAPDSAEGGCGVKGTWTLNLAAVDSDGYSSSDWALRALDNEPRTACENAAAYDPGTRKVIFKSPYGTYEYDFAADHWTQVSESGRPNSQMALAVDPERRTLVEVGGGVTALWSIDDEYSGGVVATSDATDIEDADDPGLAYDSATGQIVAWYGGTTVYTLDAERHVWTAVPAAATNVVDPGRVSTSGGAFGRFNYSPTSNVFIYVDQVTENVSLYRLGEPIPRPSPPENVTVAD